MNAGNIGPIPNPTAINPRLIMINASNGRVSDSGTAIKIAAPHKAPPMYPPSFTVSAGPK